MANEVNDIFDGWDRTFLDLSSKLATPLCDAYGYLRYRMVAPLDPMKFDNYSTVAKEVAFRAAIGLAAGFGLMSLIQAPVLIGGGAIALGAASKFLRAVGFAVQKGNFTHVQGEAPEKELGDKVRLMTWNICGPTGGFHYDHGGVVHWRQRLDGIVEKIRKEDPDVLVLEEIYDTALGEAIIARLKGEYAHFYFSMGASVFGSVGGCMVLSKCAVHKFENTDYSTNDWTLRRGFASIEIKAKAEDALPSMRIIGTHFIHGDGEKDVKDRVIQVAEVVNKVASAVLKLPTILMGDFNVERDSEEGKVLSEHVIHGYTGDAPTCTNRLIEQWDLEGKSVWDENIDNISLFKENGDGARLEDVRVSKAFDERFDTKTALSDHHAIVAVVALR